MSEDKIISADDALLQERAKLLAELSTLTKAADEVTRLREENARLREATTPICIGRRIIGILAEEGAWTSENGASVIAADELFRNDPYEENARLREKVSRVRLYATAPLKLEAMTAERDSLREENAWLKEEIEEWARSHAILVQQICETSDD